MAKDLTEPTLGLIVTPITWDGTNFHPLLSTVAGLLQISIEAATEIVVHCMGYDGGAWVATHVDAAGDMQTDILTIAEGQIKCYGYDGGAWRRLLVDAAGHQQNDILTIVDGQIKGYLWTGAAWAKVKGLATGIAQVDIDSLRGHNTVIPNHIMETYCENKSAALAADDGYRNSTAVPAGEIWKVTRLSFWNNSRLDTYDQVKVIDGATTFIVERNTAPVMATPYTVHCEIYLSAGQYLRCTYIGSLTGDVGYFNLFGKKMIIP